MKSGEERIEAKIKPDVEEMVATDFEAIPKQVEAVAERREVPNEEAAAVETVGAQKGRSRGSNQPLSTGTYGKGEQGPCTRSP
jgi:hypothetical protein